MLQCKKCKESKDINMFYKHPMGYMGVMQPCKECKKTYARSESYREGARIRDYDRYHNNNKRRLYHVWHGMRGRCYNKNNHHYKWYGLKGVTIERDTFAQFSKDMYLSYVDHGTKFGFDRKGTQIDRINGRGNYSKENCRWVTAQENANNKERF